MSEPGPVVIDEVEIEPEIPAAITEVVTSDSIKAESKPRPDYFSPPVGHENAPHQRRKSNGTTVLWIIAVAAVFTIGVASYNYAQSSKEQSPVVGQNRLSNESVSDGNDSADNSTETPSPPQSAPKIYSLNAGSTVQVGEAWEVGIKWNVEGAETISLDAGEEHFDLDGSVSDKTISISQDTSVTLKAVSKNGKEASWTIVARVPSSSPAPKGSDASAESSVNEDDLLYKMAVEAEKTDFFELCAKNQESDSPDSLYVDFANLRVSQLDYLRNTICARHGYIFSKDKYREYFSNKHWYEGTTSDKAKVNADMTETERQNVAWFDEYAKSIRSETSRDDRLRDHPISMEN